jgi:hypothetical protein
MTRVVISNAERRGAHEPLYETDQRTGVTIEVFYADRVPGASLAKRGAGWYWQFYQSGSLPGEPTGPFGTSYRAYCNALIKSGRIRWMAPDVQRRASHDTGQLNDPARLD